MSKKKRHSTPAELDDLFKRGTISEDLYQDFWNDWWNTKSERRREEIIEKYTSESIEESVVEAEEEGEVAEEKPLRGSITRNRKFAERQAKLIGGIVRRRDKSGRFNKRGNFYQAVKTTRRKR